MPAGIRSRLTYANVVSTLCLFIVLGGGAWAAAQIDSGDVKDNSLKSVDLKDGKGVKAADLPPPEPVQSAGLPESSQTIGVPPCEGIDNAWATFAPGAFGPVGYYRDFDGTVHLSGVALNCDAFNDTVFVLPPGYRPAHVEVHTGMELQSSGPGVAHRIDVQNDGDMSVVNRGTGNLEISLAPVSFRCGPSGQDGCP